MSIGIAITNAKEKLGYKDFAAMASDLGMSSKTLLRLAKITNKEDLKAEKIEILESVSIFLGMSINELINFKMSETIADDNLEIININVECKDVGIIINELKKKVKEENIKLDGFLMNKDSKQIFIDSLEISKKLAKNKL